MASLFNKVALVTGAAKGIGLAISKALLEKTGKVCANYIAIINING